MIIRFSGSAGPNGIAPRNRAQTIALAVVALAAGALLLAFGLVILAGLAVVGTVAGGGIALFHRLTGRWPKFLHVSTFVGTLDGREARGSTVPGLDPSREVFPVPPPAAQLPHGDDPESPA